MMRFYTKLNVEKKCGTEVVGPLRRIGGFNWANALFSSQNKHSVVCNNTGLKLLIFIISNIRLFINRLSFT